MARKFEREYDITSNTGVLKSERAFRRDVDLRLDTLEQRDQVIDTAAREVVDRAIRYIQQELSPKAAEIELLLTGFREGVPASIVVEQENGRQFLTPDRRAEILAAALAAAFAEIALAIEALKGGVGPAWDTLQEIAAWIANNESVEAGITAALGNRLRFEAAQVLDEGQKTQLFANAGLGAAAAKAVALAAEIRAAAGAGVLTTDQAWAAAAWVPLGNLSGAVTIDFGAGSHFYGYLTGNVTLDFANLKNGQPVSVWLIQDATGGRTVSYAANKFLFPNNAPPTIATGINTTAAFISGRSTVTGTQMFASCFKVT